MFNYLIEIVLIFIALWAIISCNKSMDKENRIIRKNRHSLKRIKMEIIKYANTKPKNLYY